MVILFDLKSLELVLRHGSKCSGLAEGIMPALLPFSCTKVSIDLTCISMLLSPETTGIAILLHTCKQDAPVSSPSKSYRAIILEQSNLADLLDFMGFYRKTPSDPNGGSHGGGGGGGGGASNIRYADYGFYASGQFTARLQGTGTGRRGRRRKRDDDPERRGPKTPVKATTRSEGQQVFACPFYLYDMHTHRHCGGRRFSGFSYVKQHILERAHRQQLHCARCGLVFANDAHEEYRHHVQLFDQCPVLNFEPFPGVSRDQERLIRQIPQDSSLSQVDKWFRVWDILFPGKPRPLSPWLTDTVEVRQLLDLRHTVLGNTSFLALPFRSPLLVYAPIDQLRDAAVELLDRFIEAARAGQDTQRGRSGGQPPSDSGGAGGADGGALFPSTAMYSSITPSIVPSSTLPSAFHSDPVPSQQQPLDAAQRDFVRLADIDLRPPTAAAADNTAESILFDPNYLSNFLNPDGTSEDAPSNFDMNQPW